MREKVERTDDENAARALQVITTVATVGIFIVVRKHLKFVKKARAHDQEFAQACFQAICELRGSGHQVTYYPGIGVFIDGLRKIPSLN